LLDTGVGKHRSGKCADQNENCSAFRHQRFHKQNYPRKCGVQIIEAMTMILRSRKRKRQWLFTTASPTQPKLQGQNRFVRRP
jgi:hypothetical protein